MTLFSKSGSSLTSSNISWAKVMRRVLWSKFSNYGTNFAATRFRPIMSEKIAWHEPTDMPTSSATSLILIRRFSIIIFFTAPVFSLAVYVLSHPGRASSFTSSRSSVKRLYHLLTFFLLTVHSPYAHFNISRVFEHIVPFFIQNLMHILWSIFFDSRKSPTHEKHF